MSAREYIEQIAQAVGRLRGRGLVLSPRDAELALSWHAAEVPLERVLAELRKLERLRSPKVRGAAEVGLSLQALAPAFAARVRAPARKIEADHAVSAALVRAAQAPRLAGREAWAQLAARADQLLAQGGDGYWTEALSALRGALRELPRKSALQAGAALRGRIAPRPSAMPRRRYRRSLQLLLLSASSETLGVPPRPFLL